MYDDQLKFLYNNIFSQAVSTSGKHIFAGNRYGDIFVLGLEEMFSDPTKKYKPSICQQGAKNQIYSLAFHRDHLIVGTTGVIYGLKFNEETEQLSPDIKWRIKIPLSDAAFEPTDATYMWLVEETDMLYVGCSDNKLYKINLDDGSIKRTFTGHTNFIHSLTATADGCVYSASEDGTVRIWKDNVKNAIHKIEPAKKPDIARPDFGKWIGDVKVSNDWLLCGGGPDLSLWNLKNLDSLNVYNYPGAIHVVDFVEDNLVVSGEHKSIKMFEVPGKVIADAPLDNTASYTLTWRQEPYKFMAVGGYSNYLHIMKDFRYVDTKVELYADPESEPDNTSTSTSSDEEYDDDDSLPDREPDSLSYIDDLEVAMDKYSRY